MLVGAVAAGAVAGSVLLVPSAEAAPKPSVDEVQRTVSRLRDEAEVASERYNDTRENLKSVRVRLTAARDRLARQRSEVSSAKAKLGALAAETYKRGDLSTLDLMLSDDPQDALAQAGYLPSLTQRQAGAAQRLKLGEQQLAFTEADIATQERKATKAEDTMRLARDTVEDKLTEAKQQLARLKASQRRALQARYEKAQAVPGDVRCGDYVAAASGRARTAIAFACDQLGEPYLWAAAGPGSWDCSGLMMGAWGAAGVSLPHSSQMQAGYGTPVSPSALQAGDLVFFNTPISHVGMYLGNGLMIHAPHSGDVVRIAAVYQTPSAAVRL